MFPTHQKLYPLQLFKFIFKISRCQFKKNVWRGYIIFQNYFRKFMRKRLKAAFLGHVVFWSQTKSCGQKTLLLPCFRFRLLSPDRRNAFILSCSCPGVQTSSQRDSFGAHFHQCTSSPRPDPAPGGQQWRTCVLLRDAHGNHYLEHCCEERVGVVHVKDFPGSSEQSRNEKNDNK